MADKPILFSGPMVRALLAGAKTQTRRVFKGIEDNGDRGFHVFGSGGGVFGVTEEEVPGYAVNCLRIAVGDRLYVREHWRTTKGLDAYSPSEIGQQCLDAGFESPWCPVQFIADDSKDDALHWHGEVPGKFRQGMHMPRWASRLTLTVTDVRVERLQDCSVLDAVAEGIRGNEFEGWFDYSPGEKPCDFLVDPRRSYRTLWDQINEPGAWDTNPWVAAYTFTVHQGNIDAPA